MAESNPSFILHSARKTSIENRPVPELKSPYDVLVRVRWTGICGSDTHYYSTGQCGSCTVKSPIVLGHESSGTVASTGSAVKNLRVGDNVALEPGIPCRQCSACKGGHYNLCPEMRFAATPPYDGTLAKYYVLPEDFCYKLPSGDSFGDTDRSGGGRTTGQAMTLEEGALIEPAAVAVHMVRRAGIMPGASVAIFGAGPIGLLCCAVARAFGASVILAVDLDGDRLAFAKKYAATHVFNPKTMSPSSSFSSSSSSPTPADTATHILHTLFQNHSSSSSDATGFDTAFDATGSATCIQTAIHLLRPGGTFVQGGLGATKIEFPIAAVVDKQLDVKGSFRYAAGDYETAIGLVAEGKVDVKALVTRKVGFEEAGVVFKDAAAGAEGKGGEGGGSALSVKTLIAGPKD